MKTENFKGLSINEFWLPLTEALIEAHKVAVKASNGDDEQYCRIMIFFEEMLMPVYGRCIDRKSFDRFLRVFIYVFEFIYGDPYSKDKTTTKLIAFTTREYFNHIMDNWNTDINEELNKVEDKNCND